MGVFNLCRKYVNELPEEKIFVTRELLAYGDRGSVDKCTQAMVGSAMIRRMARGVFVRNDIGMKDPPIEKIAEAKARAFGKHIIPSCLAQAAGLGLEIPIKLRKKGKKMVRAKPPYSGVTFAVLGTTSVFWTIHGFVKLQHIAARKYFVAQHKVGEVLAGVWHAGKDANIDFLSILRKANFKSEENRRSKELANWVPEWIHEHFRAHYQGANIHAPWRLYPFTELSFPESLMKGKRQLRVKEVTGIYRVGTVCGVSQSERKSNHDVLDPQDLLGLLTACSQGEYNFKLQPDLFSSS
jgi:hypothetical protein